MNGMIMKDDVRYDHLEKFLIRYGHSFDVAKTPDFIIFPFKDATDYGDDFFAGLKKGTPIFSGIRKSELAAKCEKYGLAYYPMIEEPSVAIRNAVPTSEGVIAYLISNRNATVFGSRILVIGYGTCGRDLCKRLKALGAQVFALVRSGEREADAHTDGVVPVYMQGLFESTAFDVIVNTVPAQILSHDTLRQTAGALLIDIASGPFGFDVEFAKTLNEKSAALLGIPGKFASKTAGEILGEYVNFVLGCGRDET